MCYLCLMGFPHVGWWDDPNGCSPQESETDKKARKLKALKSVAESQPIITKNLEDLPLKCCGTYVREKHKVGCPKTKSKDK